MAPLSVGDVAGTLGVAPSTVRMWGRRYGLIASEASPGGHRRYTDADLDRLQRMHAAVISGTAPAVAAAAVLQAPVAGSGTPEERAEREDRNARSPAPERPRRGGPGGAVLAVPGAGPAARGLARAASRLDEAGAVDVVLDALHERGALATWDEVLRPVLVSAGLHWERTGTGIEIEHLLTQAVTGAFLRYVASLPKLPRVAPILLAGGPAEDHVLALQAARAALAERGVPSAFLGPRTPMPVIAAAARRTRTPGILVWLTFPDPRAGEGLVAVRAAHRRLVLLVGGPGWAGAPLPAGTLSGSLTDAVTILERSWSERRGGHGGLSHRPENLHKLRDEISRRRP